MAGLGRKVFNSGDILLASEVQGYLQDQSVMVFDDSADRDTGIGTANFSEGMASYLKDTDQVEVYDGSAWTSVGSEPGLVHIETQSPSAVSAVEFDNVFSNTYSSYQVIVNCEKSTTSQFSFRYRTSSTDNSTSNYSYSTHRIFQATITNDSTATGTSWILGHNSANIEKYQINIFNPVQSTRTEARVVGSTGGAIRNSVCSFTATTSFDGFSILISAGTFTGTISVFGFKE